MGRLTLLSLLGAVALAQSAQASVIRNACLEAARPEANLQMCTCVQVAADRTLNPSDQRVAAGFFSDPNKAQTIKRSDSRRHEAFWERYTLFGEVAEEICAPERE